MTTNYHTPHALNAPLSSAGLNAPLGTLDAQITANTTAIADLASVGGYLSALSYGAVGDGVADDTTELQALFDAGVAANTGVIIPAGTYKISSPLIVSGPLVILGVGGWSGGTVINQATVNTSGIDFAAGADHSDIQGIKITGPGGGSAGHGIIARKTVHMRDVWVDGFLNGVWIGASGTYYAVMERLYASNNTSAGVLIASGCYNLTFIQPRLQENDYGLSVTSFTNLRIYGGSIEQNDTRGIEANGTTSNGFLLSGTYFESAVGVDAVRLGASNGLEQAIIEGCHFKTTALAGYIQIDAYNVHGLTLIGNVIGGHGAGGASLRTASTSQDVVAINNKIDGTKTIDTTHRYMEIGTAGAMQLRQQIGPGSMTAQTLVAGTAIVATDKVALITAASPITLTSTPTVASPAVDGAVVRIINVGSNAITLQDQATLAGSNIRLTAATVAIPQRGSIELTYVSAVADWVQTGPLIDAL